MKSMIEADAPSSESNNDDERDFFEVQSLFWRMSLVPLRHYQLYKFIF